MPATPETTSAVFVGEKRVEIRKDSAVNGRKGRLRALMRAPNGKKP